MQPWTIRKSHFEWGTRTYVMGILNVTPDSFSDGGQFNSLTTAVTQAGVLEKAGANILDVGGQSTRPGAETVSLATELERIIPVIETIRQTTQIPISIDTTRAAVAEAAIDAGADIVNDISAGQFEPDILTIAAQRQVPIILMHLRGTPQTMQQLTHYDNLMAEIKTYFAERVAVAQAAGIPTERIMLDPGIGFAKTVDQNLTILQELRQLQALSCPLLIGTSRKSFIGKVLNQPDPRQRLWGTTASCCAAIANGVDIIRVHDVAEMKQVCQMADAIWRTPHSLQERGKM